MWFDGNQWACALDLRIRTFRLALGVTGSLSAEETYQLRYKFAPEQVLSYVSQNDAALVIQHDQAKEEPRHTEMMIRTMRVTSVGPDGVANLDLSIDRLT